MHHHRPSCLIAVSLITTQLLGPAVLWAADQRGVRIEATRRVVVSALSGDQLTMQNGGGTKTLQFREGVAAGDRLTTGDQTMAEVLIGNRAVVTVGQGTSVQFTTVSPEQTTIQVSKGIVRVAAAASALGEQGLVTVQTPTGQVQTRGGIVRVLVDAPVRAADQIPTGEARPYLASYAPTTLLAAVNTRGDVIQVEEGLAEIVGTGPGAKGVALQSGQAITLQGGQAGPIAGITTQDTLKSGVVATAGHRSTPKEGMDNLVALQVDQATQLGKALTGAAETGEGQSGSKDESGKALNGATGGVTLANAVANALFGNGNTSNPTSANATNQSGAGYGGHNNNGFHVFSGNGAVIRMNGGDNALLVYTRMDPVDKDLIPISSIVNQLSITKELVLLGGVGNNAHGGKAPNEKLIIRGLNPGSNTFIYPYDSAPINVRFGGGEGAPGDIVSHNSTFVVQSSSSVSFPNPNAITSGEPDTVVYSGGTLGQFSNRTDNVAFVRDSRFDSGSSFVDGAITATSSNAIPVVNLTGGVTLDQGTKATIGTTAATNTYFSNPNLNSSDAKFSGSLLSVINGPNSGVTTSVTVQDRLLGVYDGSTIDTNGGNKALLSVLDAKLKGPAGSIPLIDIAAGSHFDRDGNVSVGSEPAVTVTSAVVVRSTTPLDGALLEASAPILALTNVKNSNGGQGMVTTSHFADLAGNKAQAMLLNDALVSLNASRLTIQNGNLLNLNSATATINGYLFSLNNGSTLTIGQQGINQGALFNLTGNASLTLNANAFGVFGSGTNVLNINNTFCAGTCGVLVNSAGQPFQLANGTTLKVAGVTGNVMLPSTFNVFAGPATSTVNIASNAALFKVESGSTLTINGTTVVKK